MGLCVCGIVCVGGGGDCVRDCVWNCVWNCVWDCGIVCGIVGLCVGLWDCGIVGSRDCGVGVMITTTLYCGTIGTGSPKPCDGNWEDGNCLDSCQWLS